MGIPPCNADFSLYLIFFPKASKVIKNWRNVLASIYIYILFQTLSWIIKQWYFSTSQCTRGLGVCNNVFMRMVVDFLKRSVTVTINLCYGEWLQEFPKFLLKWRRIRILKSLNFSIESTCIMLSLVIGLLTPHLLVEQH